MLARMFLLLRCPIAELLSNHPAGTTYDPYVQRSTDRPAHVRTNPVFGVSPVHRTWKGYGMVKSRDYVCPITGTRAFSVATSMSFDPNALDEVT